jgi:sugar phosphate isomerase/epimerase
MNQERALNPTSPGINPICLTGRIDGWPLAELAAAGYRSLELTPACLDAPDGWRSAAEKAGLHLVAIDALHDLTPYLTGSLLDAIAWRREATLDRLRKSLSQMASWGIPYLVVAPGCLAENYQTPAEARALLIQSLRDLSAAAPPKTAILLEGAPFRLFASSAEIAAVLDEVARPNVAAAVDIGHALLNGESPPAAVMALGPRLRYVRLHDADTRPGLPRLDRHLPLGEGMLTREESDATLRGPLWSVNIAAPSDPLRAARAALEWIRAPK